MLYLNIALALAGLIVSFSPKMGTGNPFRVYFSIWFAVLAGIGFAGDTFYTLSFEFGLLLCLFLMSYFTIALGLRSSQWWNFHRVPVPVEARGYNAKVLLLAQALCIGALPFIYSQANALAGGEVFSVVGYIQLRHSITVVGESYGAMAYVLPLAFVLSSINTKRYFQKKVGKLHLLASLSASIFLAYLSTGRTFFLMLICMVMFPLLITKKIRLKGLFVVALVTCCSFLLVTTMTAKGISTEAGVAENLGTVLRELRVYILSPVVAMGYVFDTLRDHTFGSYTFRFLFAVLGKLGFPVSAIPLIREYVMIPDETNVYTVLDPYFRDFSFVGVAVFGLLSAVGHAFLYWKARQRGAAYLYIYSAFMFALVMQFFQDMYVSLFSTWVQIVFWYWLFASRVRVIAPRMTQLLPILGHRMRRQM